MIYQILAATGFILLALILMILSAKLKERNKKNRHRFSNNEASECKGCASHDCEHDH